MKTKEVGIICITIILAVSIICGTLIYINYASDNSNDTNQSTTSNSSNNSGNTQSKEASSDSYTKSNKNIVDTDEDGYIDGKKITYRNRNYLGEDSGLEEFSTSEQKYIKQKSTG